MNNVLREACILSQEQWINSFLPFEEHVFSEKHEKKMKALFSRIRNNKYHRLTKNAIRAIIIAAIILSLAITAFAIEIVKSYNTYSLQVGTFYKAVGRDKPNINETLTVGYIPKEYNLIFEQDTIRYMIKKYKSDKNDIIIIEKYILYGETLINTEQIPYEEIYNDNIKYVYYIYENFNCIIWNDGKYAYNVNSNLPKDEVLNIAFSTK